MSDVALTADGAPESNQEQVIVRRRGNLLGRVAKWLLVLLVGLLLLAGLAVMGVNTDPGRRLVVRQLDGYELANGSTLR